MHQFPLGQETSSNRTEPQGQKKTSFSSLEGDTIFAAWTFGLSS